MAIFNPSNQSFRWLFAELTVVVIGVLIAFQVEEWRTNQSQQEFQHAMLAAMLIDLEDEDREIEIFVDMAAQQIAGTQELIALLSGTENRTAQGLVGLFRKAWITRTWLPNGPTYNSLVQTGNLSQIGDESLRRELFDYYAWTDYIARQTASYQEVSRELVSAAYMDFHFQPFETNERLQPYNYPIIAVEPIADIPRNPEFMGTLGNYGRRISQLRPLLIETQQRNLALQEMIRSEIE